MGNKVILLLTILSLSLFATAIVIHNVVSEAEMLNLDTRTITENIHRKEKIVEDIFGDSLLLKTFENAERYPSQVLDITQRYLTDHLIFLYVFKDEQPILWSTNLVVPTLDQSNEQMAYMSTDGPRHMLIKQKRLDATTKLVAAIPIKRDFEIDNEYLSKRFYRHIIDTENIDIAQYSDTGTIRNVYSKDGTYLFSVKLKEGKYHNIYLTLQTICWLLGIITLLVVINNWCVILAKKGNAWLSVLIFTSVLVGLRFILLQIDWLSENSSLGLFDPKYYAYSRFLPNLWEFIMTTLSVIWLIFYIQSIQTQLLEQNKIRHKLLSPIISIAALSSIYLFSHVLFTHLSTLITHTPSVNMDFTNILEFSLYSWINLGVFCLNIIALLLYTDVVVAQVRKMANSMTTELNIHLSVLIIFLFVGSFIIENRTYFHLLLGIIIILRAYSNSQLPQYQFFSFVATLMLISVLAAFIYMHSMQTHKINEMKLTLNYLEAEDDLNAISAFVDIEDRLANDETIAQLLLQNKESSGRGDVLDQYLRSNYIDGYLSKYESNFFYYIDGRPLGNYPNNKIDEYREKVISKAVRVPQTQYFYRLRSELGTHEYFLTMEIALPNDPSTVQVFVNLKNKAYSPALPYPEILSDSKTDFIREYYYSDGAFALYRNHFLLTQNGNYVYPTNDLQYPHELNKFIRLPDNKGYFHMMLRPDAHTTLIVSKPLYSVWKTLAIVSFLFISLFTVLFAAKGIQHVISFIFNRSLTFKNLRYQFIALRNKIRYSTRIQTMVILTVVLTVLISGTIAFFTLRSQLESNSILHQERQIAEIVKILENIGDTETWTMQNSEKLQNLNEIASIDVNLFDKNGRLIYSSQPRIYDLGLLSTYMNPIAYNELNVVKKAGLTLTEVIGDFTFTSSFATIQDDQYNTVAFINTPNYSSKREEIQNSNLLLNSLLNIYTIIILATGFTAVFVSRRITKPLEIVGEKLSETSERGSIGEPIFWEKDDEIGALVKKYNVMLARIEESTKQLMSAEREYAWREMARQITHEIKNPLTPMKLGVQQLMRSFNENDPNFEKRFNKFSGSFIEQIDNLSRIATEFSNFAKMPQTKLAKVDIVDCIQRAVTIFSTSNNTFISIDNTTNDDSIFALGDKGQLLGTFNNLLKNSVEAAHSRKRHVISITLAYQEPNTIKILIKDNGMGIPADVIPKIFQPNFTTKSSGTGLGLAFVKKTVESMGGSISFATKESIGTTFTILLPLFDASMEDKIDEDF